LIGICCKLEICGDSPKDLLEIAAWLSFFLWQRFNVNILLIFIVTLIVCLPSYSLGNLYLTLKEIIVLPERIITYFQTVQQTFAELGEAHEKVLAHSKDNLGKDSSKFLSGKKRQLIFAIGQRLKDWYFLAKKLKEVRSSGEVGEMAK
jgi:hypothetical protein